MGLSLPMYRQDRGYPRDQGVRVGRGVLEAGSKPLPLGIVRIVRSTIGQDVNAALDREALVSLVVMGDDGPGPVGQTEEVEGVVPRGLLWTENGEGSFDRVFGETLENQLTPRVPIGVSCARVTVGYTHHQAVLIDPEPGPAFSLVSSREDPYKRVYAGYGPYVWGKGRPVDPFISISCHHDRVGRQYSV
jgi:hypothetical protein